VTVLDPHVSTRGEMGHLVITVLGMVAQMERRFIKERQRDGIERAKAAGVYAGGKARIDKALVLKLKRQGLGPADSARSRVLANAGLPHFGLRQRVTALRHKRTFGWRCGAPASARQESDRARCRCFSDYSPALLSTSAQVTVTPASSMR
jgi:DNA invertase Pin-like site-specific DNA recombinase